MEAASSPQPEEQIIVMKIIAETFLKSAARIPTLTIEKEINERKIKVCNIN